MPSLILKYHQQCNRSLFDNFSSLTESEQPLHIQNVNENIYSIVKHQVSEFKQE